MDDWGKVEVIFKCGVGKDAPTQQELQVNTAKETCIPASLRPLLPTLCLTDSLSAWRWAQCSRLFAGHLALLNKSEMVSLYRIRCRKNPDSRNGKKLCGGDEQQGTQLPDSAPEHKWHAPSTLIHLASNAAQVHFPALFDMSAVQLCIMPS